MTADLIRFIRDHLNELEGIALAAGGEQRRADTRAADDGDHAIVREAADDAGVDVIARCGIVGLTDGELAAVHIAANEPQGVRRRPG